MSGESLLAPQFRACGEEAWLLDIGDNGVVHQWAATIRAAALPGVRDVVPGLLTLLVTVDPEVSSASQLRTALGGLRLGGGTADECAQHVIDVQYNGEDLAEVARHTGLSSAEVVAAHCATPWRVAFCGFAPGFAYLVGGDPRLRVPRRDEARIRVPAGAVALAGEFSSIYPRVSPGGWQLIGRTDTALWDGDAKPPALLTPGALVHFRDVNR